MKVLTLLATLSAIAISHTAAHASSITFAYTAVVNTVQVVGDQSQVPNFTSGVTPGLTSISGTFTYDLAEPVAGTYLAAGGTTSNYYAVRELTIAFPSYNVALSTFSVTSNSVYIRDNVDYCCGANDQFVATGSSPFDAQGLRSYFDLSLYGNTSDLSVFTNTNLPTSLDLASFPQRTLYFSYDDYVPNSFQYQGSRSVSATIDSLSIVTVPDVTSTLGLLGFVCAGLATANRWRRT